MRFIANVEDLIWHYIPLAASSQVVCDLSYSGSKSLKCPDPRVKIFFTPHMFIPQINPPKHNATIPGSIRPTPELLFPPEPFSAWLRVKNGLCKKFSILKLKTWN
jgi:hypothetical protein